MNYPPHWPKPNSDRPKSVATRISEQDKEDLYERKVTTRALALKLNVKEAYLSHLFPGKVETHVKAKRNLIAVRKEFRFVLAQKVLNGEQTIKFYANVGGVSYRSMARCVQVLRELKKREALAIRQIPTLEALL